MKLLIANRGEIAVRVARAARDEGLEPVGIYAEEDRLGGHLSYVNEACRIGSLGQYGPSEAYLQAEEIIRIAKSKSVDFIHPGYGYLSENAAFAGAVRAAGMKFIGPSPDVISHMGDKVKARALAIKCGIPVIPGTGKPVENICEALSFGEQHGFPIIIKAACGGGGRGMRIVQSQATFQENIASAQQEALAAFGDGSIFLEKYLSRPKHIEVQVLGDSAGNVVHLFERDCSIQRKYQKIVEIAPSTSLDPAVRAGILEASLKLARYVRYENAGTVEFLVEDDRFYFIEMNPRIQVEHTITEEITGINLVRTQLQIASGALLPDLGLTQDAIMLRGCAIQCRITTEIPQHDFRPDTGMIEVFKVPSGHGVRIDSASIGPGSIVKEFYDPMLLKCITHGPDRPAAIRTMLRALREFRVRGIETNIAFLIKILQMEEVNNSTYWTTWLTDVPGLTTVASPAEPNEQCLAFLADTIVNGSHIIGQMKPPARVTDPDIPFLPSQETSSDPGLSCQTGWRNILLEKGPKEFAKAVRLHKTTLITDTTWRDGQQSILATRVRTRDLKQIAKATSYAYRDAYSLECWGGATFDVAYRFLFEDPWERLRQLRKLVPNIPFQMLLRSTNGLAYAALPDNAIFHFVRHAKEAGIDIFRVFDSLNDVDNLKVGIDAALAAGAVVEGAILYTGDMLRLDHTKYTLEYYMDLVHKLISFDVHIISIKSMSGVMKPSAGKQLVQAIRRHYPEIPIHMHVHDNNGAGVATMAACAEAGADIVDTAIDSMSGTTSQPAVSAVLASLEHTSLQPELLFDDISAIDAYWAQLRLVYAGFDSDLRSPDPTIYKHEIPGGQYSNLLFQARELGLGSQWEETKAAYINANSLLGNIIKATPTSKAVGDLAQFMVDNKLSPEDIREQASSLDFPSSVVEFFEGSMGIPFDGFPEPLRSKVLRRRGGKNTRPGLTMKPIDFDALRADLEAQFPDSPIMECDISSYIMFPDVYVAYRRFRESYGDVSDLPTWIFFSVPEIGQRICISDPAGKNVTIEVAGLGLRNGATAKKDVFFRVDNELRCVQVLDKAAQALEGREKADRHSPADLGSPLAGKISHIFVSEGESVRESDKILAISAMKMEINVSAKMSGKVAKVPVLVGDMVDKDDLLARFEVKSDTGVRIEPGDENVVVDGTSRKDSVASEGVYKAAHEVIAK